MHGHPNLFSYLGLTVHPTSAHKRYNFLYNSRADVAKESRNINIILFSYWSVGPLPGRSEGERPSPGPTDALAHSCQGKV